MQIGAFDLIQPYFFFQNRFFMSLSFNLTIFNVSLAFNKRYAAFSSFLTTFKELKLNLANLKQCYAIFKYIQHICSSSYF